MPSDSSEAIEVVQPPVESESPVEPESEDLLGGVSEEAVKVQEDTIIQSAATKRI